MIDNPNNLNVVYTTTVGEVILNDLYDFGVDWEHFAFTYDQATGVGKVYIGGQLVGMHDGPDGVALRWSADKELQVGWALDGGVELRNQTVFDELRISDRALHTTEFLAPFGVPEPASLGMLTLGGLFLVRCIESVQGDKTRCYFSTIRL